MGGGGGGGGEGGAERLVTQSSITTMCGKLLSCLLALTRADAPAHVGRG